MAEQQTGVPFADGLSWASDSTKEHPERYMTILGGVAPLSLSKVQALALFRIMLSHLAQLTENAGDELSDKDMLHQVDLVQLFNFSMEVVEDNSDADLLDRQTLKEALEQYYFASDFREELVTWIDLWEKKLEREYDRLESAASKMDVDLEELSLEEDEDELEEGDTEEGEITQ